MRKRIFSALIMLLVLLVCLTACSKEAKFYEYTGPMPFENSTDVEFGMTVEEVENIVGELEKSESAPYSEYEMYISETPGGVKDGGTYKEIYSFDDSGLLAKKVVNIHLAFDAGSTEPEEYVALGKEKYFEMRRNLLGKVQTLHDLSFPEGWEETFLDEVYYLCEYEFIADEQKIFVSCYFPVSKVIVDGVENDSLPVLSADKSLDNKVYLMLLMQIEYAE